MTNLLSKLGFDKKTFIRFMMVAINSQLIYAFISLRNVLYDPFLEALNVTNTQLGVLVGLIGFISTFGGVTIGWLQDRFSIRKILSVNTFMYGSLALILTLWRDCPFGLKCLFFISFGFNADAMYWATVLKSVRVLAKPDRQATAFGLLETIRGVCQLATNTLGVVVYSMLGSTVFGMRIAMGINAAIGIISGLVIWFGFPEENLQNADTGIEKTKNAFRGFQKALKMPIVWLTGIAASCVYASFVVVNGYFVPYLNNVYMMPVAMAAIFGIFNGSFTRMLASPIAGIVSDKKFKSSAHLMRVCYAVLSLFLVVILVVPKKPELVVPAMVLMLLITVFCFIIRGVYYAPIGEFGVPVEMSAAAMAVASFIGYSPSFWAYPLIGWMLDRFPAEQAYQKIFLLMLVLLVVGFFITTLVARRIVRHKAELAAAAD